MNPTSETRRHFVKKAAYVAPAILTLRAAPSFAKSGSEKPDKKDKKVGAAPVELTATGGGIA